MANREFRHWYGLALLVVIGALLYLLSPILTPFVAGAALAYLGDPLADRLEAVKIRGRHVPRAVAVSLVFVAIFSLITLFLLILIPQLEAQITNLLKRAPDYLNWVRTNVLPWVKAHLPVQGQLTDLGTIRDALSAHWQQAGGLVTGLIGSVSKSGLTLLGWLANLLLIPVITFYLLRDWDEIMAGMRGLLPRDSADTWTGLAREADDVLSAFLRGQLAVMAGLALLYVIGLSLIGLDFALLIGLIAGLVSFVPYLGLIVGVAIAGVASVLQFQGPEGLLWVAVVFVVAQAIEGTVLTPKLVGDRIGLHPVAVIFAVMAGGQLYGFFGVLLALPVAAVAMVGLRHIVARYRAANDVESPSTQG